MKIDFDPFSSAPHLGEARRPAVATPKAAGDDRIEARPRGDGAACIRAGMAALPGGPNG